MATKITQKLLLPSPKLNRMYLLELIGRNPDITQAELAQRCSLSVAMVNNYMKEFLSLGLLEYRRKSTKNISYHLTGEGAAAVESISQEYVEEMVSLLAEIKGKTLNSIMSQANGHLQRVVIYGSGNLAELVYHALDSANIAIVGICDIPVKEHRECCGRQILNPSQIRFLAPDAVVVATPECADELSENFGHLLERGIRIIRLDGLGLQPVPMTMPAAQHSAEVTH